MRKSKLETFRYDVSFYMKVDRATGFEPSVGAALSALLSVMNPKTLMKVGEPPNEDGDFVVELKNPGDDEVVLMETLGTSGFETSH